MNKPSLSLNLDDLHLLHLINYHRSITATANAIQISQSALSRKLQTIEAQLGITLFQRSTRKIDITPACKQLLDDTSSIPNILDSALQRISENFLGTKKRIKIGISQSLSLAHLPGIFHPQSQLQSDVQTIISQLSREPLINQVISNQLDIGIVNHSPKLEEICVIHHKMEDRFCLVLPAHLPPPSSNLKHFKSWAENQQWILPSKLSSSRKMIEQWFTNEMKLFISPTMELENFDLMCQLVALNMGVAIIPKRALTAFPRKKQLQVITPKNLPIRTLTVIGPKNITTPEHISTFTQSILFS